MGIITTMDIIWYTALCMSLIAFASARSKGSMDQHALRLNNEAEQEMDTLVEETRQLNEEMEDSASMFKAGSDAISDSSSTGISTAGLFASGDAALGANAGGPASMFKAGSDAISDSSSKGISTDDLFASGDAALGANAGDSESKFNGLKRAKTGNRLKDIHKSKQSKGGCATITCLDHDFKCQKDKKKCLDAKMCQRDPAQCAMDKFVGKIKKSLGIKPKQGSFNGDALVVF